MGKTFLCTEAQASVPFEHFDWEEANGPIKTAPGLIRTTWLSGFGTNTIGGFYEFDSAELAQGSFAEEARQAGAAATTRLFGREETGVDLRSPYSAADPVEMVKE